MGDITHVWPGSDSTNAENDTNLSARAYNEFAGYGSLQVQESTFIYLHGGRSDHGLISKGDPLEKNPETRYERPGCGGTSAAFG